MRSETCLARADVSTSVMIGPVAGASKRRWRIDPKNARHAIANVAISMRKVVGLERHGQPVQHGQRRHGQTTFNLRNQAFQTTGLGGQLEQGETGDQTRMASVSRATPPSSRPLKVASDGGMQALAVDMVLRLLGNKVGLIHATLLSKKSDAQRSSVLAAVKVWASP
jgi:hypothetical protein